MKENKMKWKVLIISLVIVYAVASIGSLFTSAGVNSEWYETIKPSITPPSIVFPIVWNVLFLLIAISLYLAWTCAKNKEDKIRIGVVFGINFILNILWSVFYFGMKNPSLAFINIILLTASIIIMIRVTYKINKTSSYLLWPYLIWVLFAIVLNWLSI